MKPLHNKKKKIENFAILEINKNLMTQKKSPEKSIPIFIQGIFIPCFL